MCKSINENIASKRKNRSVQLLVDDDYLIDRVAVKLLKTKYEIATQYWCALCFFVRSH